MCQEEGQMPELRLPESNEGKKSMQAWE